MVLRGIGCLGSMLRTLDLGGERATWRAIAETAKWLTSVGSSLLDTSGCPKQVSGSIILDSVDNVQSPTVCPAVWTEYHTLSSSIPVALAFLLEPRWQWPQPTLPISSYPESSFYRPREAVCTASWMCSFTMPAAPAFSRHSSRAH